MRPARHPARPARGAPRALPLSPAAPAAPAEPTLQRRLMRLVLLATPALWAVSMLLGSVIAHVEIDEMFDAELVRMAQQLSAALPAAGAPAAPAASSATSSAPATPPSAATPAGATPVAPRATTRDFGVDVKDLLVVAWDDAGRRMPVEGRDAQLLPYHAGAPGFVDLTLRRRDWRVFYLPRGDGRGLVAVAQRLDERRELVRSLAFGPLAPWLLTLPLLLLALGIGLRRVLRPLGRLSAELRARAADDLRPLDAAALPADLRPLVEATNAQFARVASLLERERRFTADAAHELRTPLAVLQAQWDAALLAAGGAPLPEPLRPLGEGLGRMSRLVSQMLLLSRVEHREGAAPRRPVDWPALVAEAFTDALPLAERRGVELACEDEPPGAPRLPLQGDAPLLLALLRNLLDNALRHSPRGGQVTLRFGPDRLEVLDDGPGVPAEQLARLGDRFFRPPGETEPGSGLGLSIVRRIADWHGLAVEWGPREDAPGFRVRLRRAPADGGAEAAAPTGRAARPGDACP